MVSVVFAFPVAPRGLNRTFRRRPKCLGETCPSWAASGELRRVLYLHYTTKAQ